MNYWVRIEILIATIAIVHCMIPFFILLVVRQMKIRNELLAQKKNEAKQIKIPSLWTSHYMESMRSKHPLDIR